MRQLRAMFIMALAIAASAPSALAQRSGGAPDSIPRALAEALLAQQSEMLDMLGLGDGRPRIVVSGMPATLAQRVWIPPGARVLGGSEASGTSVAIIRSTLSPDSLAAGYRREQIARGWTRPPARPGPYMSGFVPAPTAPDDPDGALTFCSSGTVLIIRIVRVAGEQEIAARAAGTPLSSVCTASRAMPSAALRRDYYPTLVNPPGTGNGMSADCPRWNSRGGGGSTRLSTSMSLDEILAHYGRQLADSAWQPVTGRELVVRTWTRRDSTGAFVELSLTAVRTAAFPSCVELEMQVNAMTPR